MNPKITKFGMAGLALLASINVFGADKVTGTVVLKTFNAPVKFAYMVRSPGEMDPSQNILRIYFSSADIGAAIKACTTLSCADHALTDGAMVDYGDAEHLAFAVRVNNERVQYSGGTHGDAFTLTTNKPDHLAGKLHIDDTAMGGAKVDADFDLGLTNTFKTIR